MADQPIVNSVIVGLNRPGTRNPTLVDGGKYMRNRETGVVYPWHEVGAKRETMEEFIYKSGGKEVVIRKPEALGKKVSFANAKQNTPQRAGGTIDLGA